MKRLLFFCCCDCRLLFAAVFFIDEFVSVCVFYINNSYSIYMCIFFIFVDLHVLCELAFCHAYMYRACPINCICVWCRTSSSNKKHCICLQVCVAPVFLLHLPQTLYSCVYPEIALLLWYCTAFCLTKYTALPKRCVLQMFFYCLYNKVGGVGPGPPLF